MENAAFEYKYPLAHPNYGEDEIQAVVDTLRAGRTTCGPRVQEFERQFASYVGSKQAVMVNSGSSADLLVAFGLGEPDHRDEILIPAVTWPTQVWSCLTAGYKVRLIDVDPVTLQMNTNDLARNVSDKTRAVFLVHLLGCVGDIDLIKRIIKPYDIDIIEDCCESLGSRWRGQHVGTFGNASAFSFFFSHLLNTMEGGMVVTNSDDKPYRLLRSHGWEPQPDCRFWFPTWGFNLRPMEIQGAFGCTQMAKLKTFHAARHHNARLLTEIICTENSSWLRTAAVLPDCEPVFHGFPILTWDATLKAPLCSYLEQHGIETRPIVAGNLARQHAVTDMHSGRVMYGPLTGADVIHDCGFYIGVSSFNDDNGIAHVSDVLSSFYDDHVRLLLER